ncbi:MAG: flavin reductase family protein [Elusimicrobiota bacterium]|jgi:flavin reductase (DIM6/NTAB) family NADH-FMN oxidoreductase RutF|nr:flavin reductase family protein [Elusimicrobiota bacterium]
MDTKALMSLSYGMYVLSTMDGNRPTGCIVNSAIQVSSEPPTIAVCVNKNNWTNACIKIAGSFALSILSEDIKPITIGKFGFFSGKNINKFDEFQYELLDKMPVLKEGICGRIVCKLIGMKELSTHTLFLGEAIAAEQKGEAKPMTYNYYHTVIKGKSPESAPTYQKS